jgi:16S rRNA (uracil1498-N3)-methyltransferase
LVQAVTRPALLDEVLEKGTEVGTSFFMVVPADESTRIPQASVAGRLERWRRIVVEAAKQSKHLQVPTVEWAASLKEALDILRTRSTLCLLLEPSAKMALRERLEPPAGAQAPPLAAGGTGALALCVGPESGWSERELESFSAAGIEAVRLGQGVLRAETAGPVAVAATRLVIGDW